MKRNPASWWTALVFALVVVLVAGSLAYGEDVRIIQGNQVTTGADIRQPVDQPDGFTQGTATSADPGVAKVEDPNQAMGSEGINITITGSGLSLITVTWKNPKTGETRTQHFLVNSTKKRYSYLGTASLLTVTEGSTTEIYYPYAKSSPPADPTGHVTFGNGPNGYTASMTADKPGVLYLANDNTSAMTIVIITKKPTAPAAATPSTTPSGGGGTTTTGPSGTNVTPAINLGGATAGAGVKTLPVYKDPKTGNTTTGTTKTVTPTTGTTVTTTNTVTATPTGTDVSRNDVTVTETKSAGGTIRTSTGTIKSANGDEETTEVSESFDAAGTQTGGDKVVIKVDPQKKTRTTTIFKWDEKTKTYVPDGTPKVETIASATHPNVYLPDTASAGSVVTGTVETQVNEAAAGTVTVTAPSGGQRALLVGDAGHFLIPAALVVAGARLTIRDELGNVIANEVLHVLSGTPDSQALPQIGRTPDVLPQGGIARVTGSNLCTPTATTVPNAVLTTPQTANVVPALASSNTEMEFRVPRTVPPGSGTLAVENGAGQMSAPQPVNPVKISITTPPTVRVGQAFDATIAIAGLTPENQRKTLLATVTVTGNATFADGQREMRVPIKDGAAKVPVVAKGPGGYEVRVTGISNATQ